MYLSSIIYLSIYLSIYLYLSIFHLSMLKFPVFLFVRWPSKRNQCPVKIISLIYGEIVFIPEVQVSLSLRQVREMTSNSPFFSTVLWSLRDSLKFNEPKEFEEILVYIKALRWKEENLQNKKKLSYLQREDNLEERDINSTDEDIEPSI
jgi:hypothetical protein